MRGGAMGMTTALIYPPSSYYARPTSWSRSRRSAAKYGGIYASHMRGEGQGVIGVGQRAHRRSAKQGRAAGRDLPSQGRVPAGLGHPHGFRAADGRSGARARRRRRGRYVRLHGRRHGSRGDDPELGVQEGGTDSLKARLAESRDSRAAQARGHDRLARLVEHHRGGGRLGRHRARERAQSGQREVRAARRSRRSHATWARIPPTSRGISSRRAAAA